MEVGAEQWPCELAVGGAVEAAALGVSVTVTVGLGRRQGPRLSTALQNSHGG